MADEDVRQITERPGKLPPAVDTDDVTAEYANGILTIKLGLSGERAKGMKKIQVTNGN